MRDDRGSKALVRASDTTALARWLHRQQEADCTYVVMRQRTHDSDQQVREWNLAAPDDLEALALEILECAQEDGRFMRGPSLYGVFAYRPGSTAHVDRTFVRIEGQGTRESFFTETEQPDARGVVSQLMRHTEVSARLALSQTADIIEHYRTALAERDKRVTELEQRHQKTLELQEQLRTLEHERELEREREKRAAEREEEKRKFWGEKLNMLMPIVMAKLASASNGGPPPAALGEKMIGDFLKSLTGDQMASMMSMLRPEQTIAIGEVYDAYVRKDEAKEAADAAAAAKNGKRATNGTNGTS